MTAKKFDLKMTKGEATSILMSNSGFLLNWWFKLLSVCLHFRGLGGSPVYGKCTSKRLFNSPTFGSKIISQKLKKTDIHLGKGYFAGLLWLEHGYQ